MGFVSGTEHLSALNTLTVQLYKYTSHLNLCKRADCAAITH